LSSLRTNEAQSVQQQNTALDAGLTINRGN
jgi:hypothetical protein